MPAMSSWNFINCVPLPKKKSNSKQQQQPRGKKQSSERKKKRTRKRKGRQKQKKYPNGVRCEYFGNVRERPPYWRATNSRRVLAHKCKAESK
ncbi:hypothetical protein AVEN_97796-1 [Araneus ventricosus]|uniref:Uncharacterized protein n=1 Tax=Araneus ventricosus TaxID=182803 RepID=A0A4Y2PJF0_ARAVE|nr:hypothetical protein AVEN_97796-1 [Araneus ventricosus]